MIHCNYIILCHLYQQAAEAEAEVVVVAAAESAITVDEYV